MSDEAGDEGGDARDEQWDDGDGDADGEGGAGNGDGADDDGDDAYGDEGDGSGDDGDERARASWGRPSNGGGDDEGSDPDVSRNLELLQQLGLLGPKNKKAKKVDPSARKRRQAVTPARVSSRLKGEDPQLDASRPAPVLPLIAMAAERGAEPTSYRNVVTGTLETYGAAHRDALCARDAYAPYVAPAGAQWSLTPDAPPCQHCRLRSTQPLSRCATCNDGHGAICGACLWRRYGENITQLAADWRCPHCRALCNCFACRLSSGWGAVGDDAVDDALRGGFASLAHALVERRMGADGSADVEANPVRKRGRPLGGGGEWLRRLRRVQRSLSFAHTLDSAADGATRGAPLVMASGVVLSLGRVVWDRPNFHSADYIYPVGYRVQRIQHMDGGGVFVMELAIVDAGDRPLFRAFATDAPATVYDGPVASTPIAALLNARAGRHRTTSGPRLMYLDDVMVKAALHAASIDAIFNTPERMVGYRYLVGDAFVLRRGAHVAVRGVRDAVWVARTAHDAVILRRDPLPFALTVDWAECVDPVRRRYVFAVGRDDIPCHAVFFHFSDAQFVRVDGARDEWALDASVPDLLVASMAENGY